MPKKCFLSILCAVLLALPIALFSQQTLGSITGTTSDPTGALVSGTEIRLVNNNTGFTKIVLRKNLIRARN
jgi:hypothetical protein